MKKLILGRINEKETYLQTIINVLQTPADPQKGTNYEEMAEVMPILIKLKGVTMPDVGDAMLLIEDAEHKTIVKRLKSAPFGANNIELFEMIEAVIASEDHLVAAENATA